MKLLYTPENILRGALIYSSGDTVAAFITGDYSWQRFLAVALTGATLYAFEIPNYFRWIDKKTMNQPGIRQSLLRTILAMLYFNPVWIARHLAIITWASPEGDGVSWDIFQVAGWSFLVNIPISFAANFFIQNTISLRWRFVASALFSALLAVYYALSLVFFAG